MYAIIATGGKQYSVAEGQTVCIEKLTGDSGGKVHFDQVLFVGGNGSPHIGQPTVSGASVAGEIVAQDRAAKVIVFKKHRRKGYKKKYGHRQPYTEVTITKIAV